MKLGAISVQKHFKYQPICIQEGIILILLIYTKLFRNIVGCNKLHVFFVFNKDQIKLIIMDKHFLHLFIERYFNGSECIIQVVPQTIVFICPSPIAASIFTRWGICAGASIGFGMHFWWMSDVRFTIVVDSQTKPNKTQFILFKMAAFRGVGKMFQTISLTFSTNCTSFLWILHCV